MCKLSPSLMKPGSLTSLTIARFAIEKADARMPGAFERALTRIEDAIVTEVNARRYRKEPAYPGDLEYWEVGA